MIHRTTGVRGHEGTKYLLVRVTSSNILKANQITLATLVAFYRLKAADSLTSRQKVQAGDCCERAISAKDDCTAVLQYGNALSLSY